MPKPTNFFIKHKSIILYGLALAILLFLLRWLELQYLMIRHSFEVYTGAIAAIFTVLGIWIALKLSRPKIKTVILERDSQNIPFKQNEEMLSKLQLSKREIEVLELIATGLSNQEIADRLFVSVNTIKTHTSRLFEKLEVKRRTQAIEMAKRLQLIP